MIDDYCSIGDFDNIGIIVLLRYFFKPINRVIRFQTH